MQDDGKERRGVSDGGAEQRFRESLEGVEGLRVDCEAVDAVVEADANLAGEVQVEAQADDGAPLLRREGSYLVLYQRGHAGCHVRLAVPERGCPPITGRLGKGDVIFRHAAAPIQMEIERGDVLVAGGSR